MVKVKIKSQNKFAHVKHIVLLCNMKEHKSIRIECSTLDKVRVQAMKEGRSLNNMIERILENHFAEDTYMTTNQGDKIKIDPTK